MSSISWSDDELRDYVARFEEDPSIAAYRRAGFHREVLARVAPAVQRRMLATVGVTVSAQGIALMTSEVVDHNGYWSAERTWLLICDEPWEYLTQWASKRATGAYRRTVGKKSAKSSLKGIEAASTRRAIAGPEIE